MRVALVILATRGAPRAIEFRRHELPDVEVLAGSSAVLTLPANQKAVQVILGGKKRHQFPVTSFGCGFDHH